MKELNSEFTYTQAGVDTFKEERALKCLLEWTTKTKSFRVGLGRVKLNSTYFANVLELDEKRGIAISTDGVGTKLLVAQMMNKYDTIGIDCVAMNVNDVLCVGAEPISMVDYLAVQEVKPDLFHQIGKGLYEGARQAGISICGGEIAQVREVIRGIEEGYGFDLAGTCVGMISLDKIVIGEKVKEEDVILGLRSNGIHSNGFTLARRVLLEKGKLPLDKYFPELGKTLGEELLEPTSIYVPEIMEMLRTNVEIKALIHITGDGFLNLKRIKQREVGFVIDKLPQPPYIFSLIQQYGKVSDEEMFRVFNMGVGFCIIVSPQEVDKCERILRKHHREFYQLGYVVRDEEEKIVIKPKRLIGKDNKFYKLGE